MVYYNSVITYYKLVFSYLYIEVEILARVNGSLAVYVRIIMVNVIPI